LKNARIVFIVLTFLCFNLLFASQSIPVDSLIHQYKNGVGSDREIYLEKIIQILLYSDTLFAREKLRQIILINEQSESADNATTTILSLIYFAYKNPLEIKIKYLNKALLLAEKYNKTLLIGRIKSNLSEVYFERRQFDSSMIALLDAKKYIELSNEQNEIVDITHKLGDFYYYVNLLDDAEKNYRKVLLLEGEENSWKYWRYVVINNNLGNIAFKRKNYSEAEKYYYKSLAHLFSYDDGKLNKNDSLQITFTYQKLALNKLEQNSVIKANKLWENAARYLGQDDRKDITTDQFLIKAQLLLKSQKKDSVKYYLDMAYYMGRIFNLDVQIGNSYQLYSEYYKLRNDYKSAFEWMTLYYTFQDSINTEINRAYFIQLKADSDSENFESTIGGLENTLFKVILVTGIIFLLLIAVIIIYLRLRATDRKLVEKNIQIVKMDEGEKYPSKNDDAFMNDAEGKGPLKTQKDKKTAQVLQLIEKMDELMDKERIFLNSNLTVDMLAQRIGANRTYISNAIRQYYQANFSGYINELRIKESIRIIAKNKTAVYTLEGIAHQVGFNNRTSFIAAFKKYTGVLPSTFIKNIN